MTWVSSAPVSVPYLVALSFPHRSTISYQFAITLKWKLLASLCDYKSRKSKRNGQSKGIYKMKNIKEKK